MLRIDTLNEGTRKFSLFTTRPLHNTSNRKQLELEGKLLFRLYKGLQSPKGNRSAKKILDSFQDVPSRKLKVLV
jgi:hypothetical protein